MTGEMPGAASGLAAILMAVLVCALAYAATRMLAGRLSGRTKASKTDRPGRPFSFGRLPRRPSRLEIVDRLGIGRDRQILIVRAGSQHFLAGVSAGSIQFGPPVTLEPAASAAGEPAGDAERKPDSPAAAPVRFEAVLAALLQQPGFDRGRERE